MGFIEILLAGIFGLLFVVLLYLDDFRKYLKDIRELLQKKEKK